MQGYRLLVHATRIMIGALFIVSALEGLYFVATGIGLLSWPMTPATQAFVRALQASGFFWPFLKGVELIGGVLLLSNRYVPLGLALLLPVIATIVLMHLAINLPGGWPYVIGLTLLSGWLLWAYRGAFRGLFAAQRQPDAVLGDYPPARVA
jgi:hypothetical protein